MHALFVAGQRGVIFNSPSHIPVLIEHQLRVMNTIQLGQSPYVNMGTVAVVDQTRPPLLFF